MGTPQRGRIGWQLLLVMLAACSNGSGSLENQQPPPAAPATPQPPPPAPTAFTIGGSVTGLSGGGLVLQNNGAGNLTIAADGSFQFVDTASTGAAYNVTVLTQPATPPQTCTVANGAGAVASSNVTNIVVVCTNAPRYTIGVTVSGLAGTGLVLQNNAGDNLAIPTNGNFVFATALTGDSAYSVTVATQPNGQNCTVRNATGTIAAANVTNVEVACAANQFTVGGSVAGLTGKGLVLQLNDANDLAVVNNGPFSFPTALAPSATYKVTVKTQPSTPTQDCQVANPTGTIATANVSNVAVTCTTKAFKIGGTVSGLKGSGLELFLNGANDLPVRSDGSFTFANAVLSGNNYRVTVKTQPSNPAQQCTVANGVGPVVATDIMNIAVTCATRTFSISGTVIGLVGAPLVLTNNGGDALTVTGTSFRFATQVASGAAYDVRVQTQPLTPKQMCSIANGSGTIGTENVSNIVVTCNTTDLSVGGTVNNLIGSGLELSNNDSDKLRIGASGPFTFRRAVPSGSAFNVKVDSQPTKPKQTCTVEGTTGTGTVGNENVTSVIVNCVTEGFFIGGTVTGLTGTGLILQNNAVENLEIAAEGAFRFPTPLLPGAIYNVTILQAPTNPAQFCYFASPNSGVVGDRDVDRIVVACF